MTPIRIACIYLTISILWILLSDRVLQWLVSDPVLITRWQTGKGWIFCIASTALLYVLAVRLQAASSRQLDVKRRHLALVRRKAYTDHLTGLSNRRFGMRAIRQQIQAAKREYTGFSVLLLDLDNFKQVNDTLGHSAGDLVIQSVGRRLQENLEPTETLTRHGGNEFLLICPGLETSAEVFARAEDIIHLFREPILLGPMPLRVTASVGIARYPADGMDIGSLMRCADLALHHSKIYKNCFKLYQDRMSSAMHYRFDLEQKLREAIDKDELQVRYQPIYDPRSRRFSGAEALLRWEGTDGAVSPSEFIPIAEQCGQIRALGARVLMRACQDTQRLSQRLDRPLTISINVSPKQFANDHIVTDLRLALEQSGIDPGQVILEITEGVFLSNAAETGEILQRLIALGVCLSMDDFGQGYSSLSYLRRHPFRFLKIDRTFVQGVDSSLQDRALVEASVAMAKALQLQVVGEGVETGAQEKTLTELGVHFLQGFHLARPLTFENYEQLLDTSPIESRA